jgi:hypothetical protein
MFNKKTLVLVAAILIGQAPSNLLAPVRKHQEESSLSGLLLIPIAAIAALFYGYNHFSKSEDTRKFDDKFVPDSLKPDFKSLQQTPKGLFTAQTSVDQHKITGLVNKLFGGNKTLETYYDSNVQGSEEFKSILDSVIQEWLNRDDIDGYSWWKPKCIKKLVRGARWNFKVARKIFLFEARGDSVEKANYLREELKCAPAAYSELIKEVSKAINEKCGGALEIAKLVHLKSLKV